MPLGLRERVLRRPAAFPAMNAPPGRDPNEALAALERLYHKQVVTLEEAKAAARLITGDENAEFPPPRPPPAAAPPPEPVAAPTPSAEGEAPSAEGSANNGGSG